MAGTAICRCFVVSNTPPSLSFCKRLFSTFRTHLHASSSTPPPSLLSLTTTTALNPSKPATLPLINPPNTLASTIRRSFTTTSEEEQQPAPTIKRNTKVNFSLSDSDSDSDSENTKTQLTTRRGEIDKTKLPPPYDPFNKKAVIEEPGDPKNLQEVFHKIRNDGLINNAVKMFDALSKDGLTHEALELFGQIKDKGNMPDVVAHTAVIEAYANAGQGKDALKVYLRMLASGVTPNAYTYTVLIKGLASSGDAKLLGEAKKYVVEMMDKGMRPNAGTYVAVFEAFASEGNVEEGSEFLEQMKAKGFVPDEKAVREVLRDKRGPVFRSIMNLLFGK
ncbi:pentatricopeptide repeat-containing protein At4g38150-like [Cornus florida]|uniref:pentatricopeptide repeat-containing protein At4g38150-like n=1 Tax=Cornus florida TaxID=4283 RepID=UPI0028A242AA|nr:pentatricopeptide repeat-containing protein At4g38150-like [Cornus florida]XP_059648349.1 pentatricopeptide repeat-containing protein At4g38150-like [Cornus florida]